MVWEDFANIPEYIFEKVVGRFGRNDAARKQRHDNNLNVQLDLIMFL